MMTLDFVHRPAWALCIVAAHLAIGTGLGLLYFHIIWRSVRVLAGAPPVRAVVIAMAARFAMLAGVLLLTSLEGVGPLLATALGVMAGRFLVMRRVRGASA